MGSMLIILSQYYSVIACIKFSSYFEQGGGSGAALKLYLNASADPSQYSSILYEQLFFST
jgi:hypothetical protein